MAHWGGFRIPEETVEIPDVTADIQCAMQTNLLCEYNEPEDFSASTQQIIVPPLNANMLYGIALHKYVNGISDTIDALKSNKKALSSHVPQDLKMPRNAPLESGTKLSFVKADFALSAKGGEAEIPELSHRIAREILSKAVATLFAHIGYQSSEQSALDVVTDCLESFFEKISGHLNTAIEDEENMQSTGFPNITERVLTEIGMGGVKGLNDYYKSQVVKYTNILEDRCREWNVKYETLLKPEPVTSMDNCHNIVGIKTEKEDDVIEMENPQIQLSTIDGNPNFSLLMETGFQLLNSFEAETSGLQHQGMENKTASNNSTAPCDDNLSPYTKKKRFK